MKPEVRISANRDDLDVKWVITQTRESYWGEWMTPIQIMRAIDHSLCFGAFIEREQVGFLRVVTDHSVFSSITDLIVAEQFRRQGIGRKLVEAALAHPWVAPTICILNTHEPVFYLECGFRLIGNGHVMQHDPK